MQHLGNHDILVASSFSLQVLGLENPKHEPKTLSIPCSQCLASKLKLQNQTRCNNHVACDVLGVGRCHEQSPVVDASLFARAEERLDAAAVSSAVPSSSPEMPLLSPAMPWSSPAMPLSPPTGLRAAAEVTRFLQKRFGCFLCERLRAGRPLPDKLPCSSSSACKKPTKFQKLPPPTMHSLSLLWSPA